MFGAIWSKSAYFRTPQLHSGSVEDHLDPSRHLRSYPPTFGNHRDTSAKFRDCQGPSVPMETCLDLSGPSQKCLVQKVLGLNKCLGEKNFSLKNFWPKKLLGQKIFPSKEFLSKIFSPKKTGRVNPLGRIYDPLPRKQ